VVSSGRGRYRRRGDRVAPPMSASGTNRKCQSASTMSALGGNLDGICSLRAFPLLTRSGHQFDVGGGGGGDTIICMPYRTQRALVPAISQAGSSDTMLRRHFRTGISSGCRDEIILWTDIGTHHVMKHWINLQPFSPASRAHRLIPFQSASRAPRAHPRRRFSTA
jgi:hypothetical protein